MMVEKSGRPAYLQIVDELRGQIRAGSLPPGTALPSIAQLCERFDVSASVVKAAISVLRTEGVVIGQQGKGVFVRETPAETPEPEASEATAEILDQLTQMRQSLKELGDRLAALESAVFQEPK
ncbi:DNA-binding GntR family transcriptional regulator [Streptosporangium becharense]|uniref:DNA-binding GntR family transcriptional regulator n=1 Tax=Streptosporangium becharense TaxID=1816182 RepID=A0A7W9IIL4_9ACTN|nr:winged helix-turn-helix domain-containing protein [Streptosporangium becharense]MBB2912437.1 DNA-binding GntR family transcriptional regulator [Streptosporangium becharense]MBB5820734.1 DNA-binding GntR family transcriptional regulator [Streptosporangium becharense]